MKKLLLGAILLFSMLSCDGIDSKDGIISAVLKVETNHLKEYNKIQKLTKDTIVINHISKLKDSLKLDAVKCEGLVEGRTGIMFGSMAKSKQMLKEYIKLCKNN